MVAMSQARALGAGALALWLAALLPPGADPARAADSVPEIKRTLDSGGRERTYYLHVPAGLDPGGSPLVVVLHGGAGTGPGAAKQTHFSAAADLHHFIVAYPNGTDRARPIMNLMGKPGFLTWNAGHCCAYAMLNRIDDVAFIRAMVAEIERDHAIDRRQVYATGISNGGMMSYRLACEASDVFAAIGVVSGSLVTPGCAPAAPVAILHIHGTADEYVPLEGGIGRKSIGKTLYPPPRDGIALWVKADGCRAQPGETQDAAGVKTLDYRDCRAGTEVALRLIEGGGHSWPGGDRMLALLDAPSPALDATEVIWRFFAAHPKW